MPSIYQRLRKNGPIFSLAPMEDVTDTVFRRLIKSCGAPDLFYTEFTNCEGMQSSGSSKLSHRLIYDKSEKPIIAQVWGITPEDYYNTAGLILKMGFDGLDINMGCPVKKIIKQGACSALIKNPNLAKEIYLASKEGVKNKIPVSIKTRIGFDKIETEEWIGFLLSQVKPEVLTIHGRTVKQLSKVPNNWDEIAKAVELKNQIQKQDQTKTLIFGNGDVLSLQEAHEKVKKYSLDGVMIGRGIFKNPFLFNPNYFQDPFTGQIINQKTKQIVDKKIRLELLLKHLKMWQKQWQNPNFDENLQSSKENPRYLKNYSELKRFFKIYITDFPGSSHLRNELMKTNTVEESILCLNENS
jgi:tRNA-dihydrouridine synthase